VRTPLTLILPAKIKEEILSALRASGRREIGGILMAEHVGQDIFAVRSITVHRRGTFAAFVRRIEDVLAPLRAYFRQASHEYTRFNYIGEWHSHPSFEPVPSSRDDQSMREIIQDTRVGANFVVLLIVKLGEEGEMRGTVHTYLPDGSKCGSHLQIDETGSR
jgi:[CysO sulfur-carrier protein]-S-L-cysteine hydrolase